MPSLLRKHQTTAAKAIPPEQLKALAADVDDERLDQAIHWEVDFPFPGHWYLQRVVEQHPLSSSTTEPVTLTRHERNALGSYLLVGIASTRRLRLPALRQASGSGALLRYDPSTKQLEETSLSEAVLQLVETADDYESWYRTIDNLRQSVVNRIRQANVGHWESFDLSIDEAFAIWATYHMHVNLYRRAASLLAHLLGKKETPTPDAADLLPNTPFGGEMQAKIEREVATRVDVREWWGLGQPWRF